MDGREWNDVGKEKEGRGREVEIGLGESVGKVSDADKQRCCFIN